MGRFRDLHQLAHLKLAPGLETWLFSLVLLNPDWCKYIAPINDTNAVLFYNIF